MCSCGSNNCSGCKAFEVPEGPPGADGWSPQFAVVADGSTRDVLQLTGWTGGTEPNPGHLGEYVSSSGFTSLIASATNIRGTDGVSSALKVKYLRNWQTTDIEQSTTITYDEWTGCSVPLAACTIDTPSLFLDIHVQVWFEVTTGNYYQMTPVIPGANVGGSEINILVTSSGDVTITTYNTQGRYRILIIA